MNKPIGDRWYFPNYGWAVVVLMLVFIVIGWLATTFKHTKRIEVRTEDPPPGKGVHPSPSLYCQGSG